MLIPIFKTKGDIQDCGKYRDIKLKSHIMTMWERIIERRLREKVKISEQPFRFMPRWSTTDAIFAQRQLMEKYKKCQRELHCVFVNLEKVCDRVPKGRIMKLSAAERRR